jgi:hypothetical protein
MDFYINSYGAPKFQLGGRPLADGLGGGVRLAGRRPADRHPDRRMDPSSAFQLSVRWPSAMLFARANRRVERPSAGGRHGGRCFQTHGRPEMSGRTSLDVIFPEDVQSDNPV